ncbi:MAG: hypothetical protein LH471_00025 [Salinibacterium sp.]|nr:hypothetical protein [Salinibacterium sp.]
MARLARASSFAAAFMLTGCSEAAPLRLPPPALHRCCTAANAAAGSDPNADPNADPTADPRPAGVGVYRIGTVFPTSGTSKAEESFADLAGRGVDVLIGPSSSVRVE